MGSVGGAGADGVVWRSLQGAHSRKRELRWKLADGGSVLMDCVQAAVAREVLKQVYVAEKLSPPSLAQVTHTCESLFDPRAPSGFAVPALLLPIPCCHLPLDQPAPPCRTFPSRLTHALTTRSPQTPPSSTRPRTPPSGRRSSSRASGSGTGSTPSRRTVSSRLAR